MNLKKVLERLGYVENIDYWLHDDTFSMQEQMRIVGNVEEFFTKDAPSEEVMEQAWNEIQIKENDIIMLIEEYLSEYQELRDVENDSYSANDISITRWGLANIPCPTVEELLSFIPTVATKKQVVKARMDMISIGKKVKEVCDNCLDIITGFNVTRQLTAEQVTQLTIDCAPIMQDLMDRRPWSAKLKIQAMDVDGVLITQTMVDMVLEELKDF